MPDVYQHAETAIRRALQFRQTATGYKRDLCFDEIFTMKLLKLIQYRHGDNHELIEHYVYSLNSLIDVFAN